MEQSKKNKTVSVKLDGTGKETLEQKAAALGLNVNQYLQKILDDSQKEVAPVGATTTDAAPANVSAVNLTPASLLAIAKVVNMEVANNATDTISITLEPTPERELLRKLAGRPPESEETLTIEEEAYLQTLTDASKADVREGFLLDENCVKIPFEDFTPLQQKTWLEMIAIREKMATENMPSFTQIFQKAILTAFFEDAQSMYNRNLFGKTYGFERKELAAIFNT